jgi:hypothetical protein
VDESKPGTVLTSFLEACLSFVEDSEGTQLARSRKSETK